MNNRECVIGVDVSTKTCGITIMDLKGKLIDLTYINMPKKSKKFGNVTIYNKVDHFVNEIAKYKDYKVKHIYIEEPLKNGPNINTTILLAKFNGMLSQKMYEIFGIEPKHITVYESRFLFFPEYIKTEKKKGVEKQILSFPKDADKKKLVYDKVSWLEPQVIPVLNKYLSLKDENFDMSDSYVVTRAGLVLDNYIEIFRDYEPK